MDKLIGLLVIGICLFALVALGSVLSAAWDVIEWLFDHILWIVGAVALVGLGLFAPGTLAGYVAPLVAIGVLFHFSGYSVADLLAVARSPVAWLALPAGFFASSFSVDAIVRKLGRS